MRRVGLDLTLLGGAAAILAGCAFDLIEVDASRATTFDLSLIVPQCHSHFDLGASFHPGRDRDGVIRSLSDDSLRFDARGISATEVRSDGLHVYRLLDVELISGSDAPPLHVRSPVVAGIIEPPPELGIQPVTVAFPDTLVVPRSGFVAVTAEGQEGGSLGRGVHGEQLVATNVEGFWRLEVHADTAQRPIFAMNGRDVPPADLRFPADILPPGFSEGNIKFDGGFGHTLSSLGGAYAIRIVRSLRCSVPLRISE